MHVDAQMREKKKKNTQTPTYIHASSKKLSTEPKTMQRGNRSGYNDDPLSAGFSPALQLHLFLCCCCEGQRWKKKTGNNRVLKRNRKVRKQPMKNTTIKKEGLVCFFFFFLRKRKKGELARCLEKDGILYVVLLPFFLISFFLRGPLPLLKR